MKPTNSIGILREVKNKWERRVPITPTEVAKLVDRNIRVLIEPCQRRIFKDIEYERAGAIVTNDLSPSSFIIGVKDISPNKLYDNHSYLNFSHVIKGQANNMPFLDDCLRKNVRLFDYECIKSSETRKRSVAFGHFAGLSGMITGMRGLGEHLLAKGCSTPFLNMPSMYMFNSLLEAKEGVIRIGEMISKYGLPTNEYGPITFVFTGKGNVTNGALEIFKLLPHEMVDPSDLHKLHTQNSYSSHKVYGCVVPTQYIVNHKTNGSNFESAHYYDNPEEYIPAFHADIAPYTHVLVNGMYWDHRYPRLLSNEQMSALYAMNPNCMLSVFDITCDVEGSVEFLMHETSTDSPFYTYNPITHTATNDNGNRIDGDGVLMLAVDSLPAELPRESSEYFSQCLHPFLEAMAVSDSTLSYSEQETAIPSEMYNAMITCNGKLTAPFKYIEALRSKLQSTHSDMSSSSQNCKSALIRIDGHLFDSGLINQVLDMVEETKGAEYHIIELNSRINTPSTVRASRLILQIEVWNDSDSDDKMKALIDNIQSLCAMLPKAKAKFYEMPYGAVHVDRNHKNGGAIDDSTEHLNNSKAVDEHCSSVITASHKNSSNNAHIIPNNRGNGERKKVLLLGSGFVSKPVIDYLSMSGNNAITVVSNDCEMSLNEFCEIVDLDCADESKLSNEIDGLVATHDLVISLLPNTMHISIAELCVKHCKNMVTASYISDEMRAFSETAICNKIVILNEVGLDPGLDHMSAVQMIKSIRENGNEEITSFVSLCGGLPSPESANNAFGYKFSWSPIGVLRASANDAKYLWNGSVVDVNSEDLLRSGRWELIQNSRNPYPSLSLEHIANRNALKYIDKYGLDTHCLKNMYRGTIRYRGFCDVLYGCKVLGLLDEQSEFVNCVNESWSDYVWRLISDKYPSNECDYEHLSDLCESILIKNSDLDLEQIAKVLQCLDCDLDVFDGNGSNTIAGNYKYPLNAFCELLQNKLVFLSENGSELSEKERDMVIMINQIETNADRIYESSLLVYGDDHYSAMSRTVSFPLAIAAQFLLNDNGLRGINDQYLYGVVDATDPVLSHRILEECKRFGIKFRKRIIKKTQKY